MPGCCLPPSPPSLPKAGLPFFGLQGSEPSLLFIDVHCAVTVLGLGVLLLHALGCMAECSSHGLVSFSCTPVWNLDESFGRGALSGFLLLESGEGLSLHWFLVVLGAGRARGLVLGSSTLGRSHDIFKFEVSSVII